MADRQSVRKNIAWMKKTLGGGLDETRGPKKVRKVQNIVEVWKS